MDFVIIDENNKLKFMMKKWFFCLLFVGILCFSFFLVNSVEASPFSTSGGVFSDYEDVHSPSVNVALEAGYLPDTLYPEYGSAISLIAQALKFILSFLGIVFLILIFYSGIKWMIAGGNEEQITKAKDSIKGAVIGLVIIIAAYAIIFFVVSAVGEPTVSELEGSDDFWDDWMEYAEDYLED